MQLVDGATVSFALPHVDSRSRRNELLRELYQLYTSQPDYNRKENRKRYLQWMKKTHPECCKKSTFNASVYNGFKDAFKRAKLPPGERFMSYLPESKFWIKFTHLKGESGLDAIRYMVSVGRDKLHRGDNVAQYIIGSVKYVEVQPEISTKCI